MNKNYGKIILKKYYLQQIFVLFIFLSSERIESRTLTNSINNKKESTKEENKPKDNELKAKRSNPSVNGSKDNGETSLKVFVFWFC